MRRRLLPRLVEINEGLQEMKVDALDAGEVETAREIGEAGARVMRAIGKLGKSKVAS